MAEEMDVELVGEESTGYRTPSFLKDADDPMELPKYGREEQAVEEDEVEEEESVEEDEKDELSPFAERESELLKLLGDAKKEAAALRQKASFVDQLFNDPEKYLPQLAKRFGLEFGEREREEEEERRSSRRREPPGKLRPMQNEEFDEYLNRGMSQWGEYILDEMRDEIRKLAGKGSKEREVPRGRQGPPQPQVSPQEQMVNDVIVHLERNHADYGLYVDEIIEVATKNPVLAYDPSKLYQEGKKLALAKREASKAKRMQGKEPRTGERATKPQKLSQKPGKMNFEQAWELAKRRAKEK